MEQIAVYIIIIVILILTSVRKGKKQQQARLEQLKKQREMQEQQETDQVSPIDEIFKQFGGEFFDTETEQQEPVFTSNYTEKKSVPTPFLDVELRKTKSRKSIRDRDGSHFQNQKWKENNTEENIQFSEASEHFEYELSTVEELRKAIIYSEIINRKYT